MFGILKRNERDETGKRARDGKESKRCGNITLAVRWHVLILPMPCHMHMYDKARRSFLYLAGTATFIQFTNVIVDLSWDGTLQNSFYEYSTAKIKKKKKTHFFKKKRNGSQSAVYLSGNFCICIIRIRLLIVFCVFYYFFFHSTSALNIPAIEWWNNINSHGNYIRAASRRMTFSYSFLARYFLSSSVLFSRSLLFHIFLVFSCVVLVSCAVVAFIKWNNKIIVQVFVSLNVCLCLSVGHL